jgi:hypothetical protein
MWQGQKRMAALTACVCTLAIPAAAQAAPSWVGVADPAPGGSSVDLAVADGTPYLAARAAEADGGGLVVWRPDEAGTDWIQAGGTVNQGDLPDAWAGPTITADGTTPWVAWQELAGGDSVQAHVAWFDGSTWQEPVAASEPANWPVSPGPVRLGLVVFVGTPYLTAGDGHVARLNSWGDAVEYVDDGLPSGCMPSLAVSAGSLYAACSDELLRLNIDGTGWEHVATNTGPFFVVDVTGTPYLLNDPCCSGEEGQIHMLTSDDQLEVVAADASEGGSAFAGFQGSLFAAHGTDLRALGPDGWESAPSPSPADAGATGAKLVEGADGALWLLWDSSGVHVARYAEEGTPFNFAPDPEPGLGDPSGDDPGDDPGTDPGDGGFTDPEGHPVPPGHGGHRAPRPGACRNVFSGTVHANRIVGTRFGDRIHGWGGNDRLFGRGASDCIWGGRGADSVNGGPGPDALAGGGGNDHIKPGAGRDEVAAGAGNDTIDAVGGGVDRINCGRGHDTVRLSRNDLIKGCEKVLLKR